MSKTKEVAHNTIIQFAGKGVSTALGLVAVAMMTRYLGQEMFGWYTTTMAFLQFIGVLVDFGLTPVTGQMLSEPDFDNKKVMKNILGFRLVTAGIAFGLAPLIILFFPYPTEVKIAVIFTNVSFLAISLRQVLTGFYQKKLKMYVQAIGEVLGRVVLVGGVWALIHFGSSFLPFMVVVTLASIVYASFLFVYAWRKGFAGFSYDKKMWKSIAIKMWPLAISIMFNVIYLKGDTVLLSLFRPQSEVGVYGAAYKVIDILTESAMMMMGLLLPLITYAWSRNDMKQFRQRLQKSFDLMMALGVPLVVGAIILAEEIMVLVAGGQFTDSSEPLQILALAVFGVFLGATFSHTAVAMDKQKQTLWVYISDAILTLIGYLIFVPTYGMIGAAWMSVFAELYAGIFLFLTVRRFANLKLGFKTFGKILFSAAVMGGALILLPSWHVLLLVAIGGIIYALTLFTVGGISIKTIKEVIQTKKQEPGPT